MRIVHEVRWDEERRSEGVIKIKSHLLIKCGSIHKIWLISTSI
jgi:hypothetical protein